MMYQIILILDELPLSFCSSSLSFPPYSTIQKNMNQIEKTA
jgi:hypothetical protein